MRRHAARTTCHAVDKREAKRLGAWISLLGGACFVLGAIAAIYIAFFLKPETATLVLARLGRLFHHI
jgi:hypothetical protein